VRAGAVRIAAVGGAGFLVGLTGLAGVLRRAGVGAAVGVVAVAVVALLALLEDAVAARRGDDEVGGEVDARGGLVRAGEHGAEADTPPGDAGEPWVEDDPVEALEVGREVVAADTAAMRKVCPAGSTRGAIGT
jgi:hypothetical protein